LHEIVVVGDVHEGINFDIRVDPQTGVSERALDMHRNLTRAVEYAVKHEASLFIILGDLFDRTHVAPIFREYVRNDVIEPLGRTGVKVYILAGNHDQPREFRRGTSIDDFRGYPHVNVFRRPEYRVEDIAGRRICFLIMPFLHPDTLIGQAGREAASVPEDQRPEVGREVLRELLHKYSKESADHRILLAHYYFEGTDLSSTIAPEVEPGEVEFNESMIPQNLDLGVFGHVHLSQTKEAKNVPLVFVGAVEKIDWGERESEKRFLTIDPANMKWESQTLPTRDMLRLRVKIEAGEPNPTEKVLGEIPGDVKEKMVRVEIELPEGMRRLVQESALAERLAPAFDYKVRWIPVMATSIGSPEAEASLLTPQTLLESFIELNYAKHVRHDELLAKGREILKEALEE
jgi:DNA repair exonuclease SbcCD nuclease subunit